MTLRTDFSEVKSVFGFRVRLGNPDLDFENLNPDFPIERTLRLQSERSTSERGSFRFVSQSGFRYLFHLMRLLYDRKNVLVHQ